MTEPIDEVSNRAHRRNRRCAAKAASLSRAHSACPFRSPVLLPPPPIGSTSFGRQLTLPADSFISFNFGDEVLA